MWVDEKTTFASCLHASIWRFSVSYFRQKAHPFKGGTNDMTEAFPILMITSKSFPRDFCTMQWLPVANEMQNLWFLSLQPATEPESHLSRPELILLGCLSHNKWLSSCYWQHSPKMRQKSNFDSPKEICKIFDVIGDDARTPQKWHIVMAFLSNKTTTTSLFSQSHSKSSPTSFWLHVTSCTLPIQRLKLCNARNTCGAMLY